MRGTRSASRGICVREGQAVSAKDGLRSRPGKSGRRPELHEPPQPGVVCWFGATCVGVLLERMRLHLNTQRFLAARRGDHLWEASCDYAALSLERIGSRLRPGMFGQPLFPAKPRARSGLARGTRWHGTRPPRGPRLRRGAPSYNRSKSSPRVAQGARPGGALRVLRARAVR